VTELDADQMKETITEMIDAADRHGLSVNRPEDLVVILVSAYVKGFQDAGGTLPESIE
jgi:hypothetical protein